MDTVTWSVAAPAIGSAFLASLVEAVEAFTIVLAVATLQGWRPATLGTGTALGVLAVLIAVLGPLLGHIPLHPLQLVIGVLLLLFGAGWLRKAILRAAGVIPLHDEVGDLRRRNRAADPGWHQRGAHITRVDRRSDRVQGGAA